VVPSPRGPPVGRVGTLHHAKKKKTFAVGACFLFWK
jgi:hypothetical protein